MSTNLVRQNSFAFYFQCVNSPNCCVVTRDGSELALLLEDYACVATEIGGKRVRINVCDKEFILTEALRSPVEASGNKHWMAEHTEPQQYVNLLPLP
jgi:hypothetical protein